MPSTSKCPRRHVWAVALTMIGLSACSGAPGLTDSADEDWGELPELLHIHELASDPGGGDAGVLVASHMGIYRVVEGDRGTLVGPLGDVDVDAMSMAVAHGRVHASGHPGPATPRPFVGPNLGLITSQDSGQNWTNVSLTGETDFHALTVGEGGTLYGLDIANQLLMRSSDDGKTWTASPSPRAIDLLADPSRADFVYATTDRGLATSADAGQSFTVDRSAPPLRLIAADHAGASDQLVGIGDDGQIWRRRSFEATWEPGGRVTGRASALTWQSDTSRLVVADERGLVASTDVGRSWSVLIPTR